MAELKLTPTSGPRLNVADRTFPYEGHFGLETVTVRGRMQYRSLRRGVPLAIHSLAVRVRCYEKSNVNLLGVSQEAPLYEQTVTLWESTSGPFEDVEEMERDFVIHLSKEVAQRGPSALTMRKWKVCWKLEAILNHTHQPGIGTQQVHSYDLRLRNFARAARPSTRHAHAYSAGASSSSSSSSSSVPPKRYSVDYTSRFGAWTAEIRLDKTHQSRSDVVTFEPSDKIPVSLTLRSQQARSPQEEFQITFALVRQLEIRAKDASEPCDVCSQQEAAASLAVAAAALDDAATLVDSHSPDGPSKRKSLPPTPADTFDTLSLTEENGPDGTLVIMPVSEKVSPTPRHASVESAPIAATVVPPPASACKCKTASPKNSHMNRTTLAKSSISSSEIRWADSHHGWVTADLVAQRNEGAWSYGETLSTRLAKMSFYVVASIKISKRRSFSRFQSSSSDADYFSMGSDTVLLPPLEIVVIPTMPTQPLRKKRIRARSSSPVKDLSQIEASSTDSLASGSYPPSTATARPILPATISAPTPTSTKHPLPLEPAASHRLQSFNTNLSASSNESTRPTYGRDLHKVKSPSLVFGKIELGSTSRNCASASSLSLGGLYSMGQNSSFDLSLSFAGRKPPALPKTTSPLS